MEGCNTVANGMAADVLADFRQYVANTKMPSEVSETVGCYLDRIEAALKREFSPTAEKSSAAGDSAAMREALVQCELFLGNVSRHGHPMFCFGDQCTACNGVDELREMVIRALSKPARNCDIYKTSGEADRAITKYCSKMAETGECVKACPYRESEGGCAFGWLLAATGTKGEADGSK